MLIRAVTQTPYKKYNGTAPTECTNTVIPYHIVHVYVLESGSKFWPCIFGLPRAQLAEHGMQYVTGSSPACFIMLMFSLEEIHVYSCLWA